DLGVHLEGQGDLVEQLQLLGVVLELLVLVEPVLNLAVVLLEQADSQRIAAAGATRAAGLGGLAGFGCRRAGRGHGGSPNDGWAFARAHRNTRAAAPFPRSGA